MHYRGGDDHASLDPGTAFRYALALADAGVAIRHRQLARQFPHESKQQILDRLNAWLRDRPGAPFGDGEGRPVLMSGAPLGTAERSATAE
jgi:hypothetical protein